MSNDPKKQPTSKETYGEFPYVFPNVFTKPTPLADQDTPPASGENENADGIQDSPTELPPDA